MKLCWISRFCVYGNELILVFEITDKHIDRKTRFKRFMYSVIRFTFSQENKYLLFKKHNMSKWFCKSDDLMLKTKQLVKKKFLPMSAKLKYITWKAIQSHQRFTSITTIKTFVWTDRSSSHGRCWSLFSDQPTISLISSFKQHSQKMRRWTIEKTGHGFV